MQVAVVGMVLGVLGHARPPETSSPTGGSSAASWSGTVVGVPMGLLIPMTKMPERIALSHAGGGLAVALVGIGEYLEGHPQHSAFAMGAVSFEVLMGAITFTGSLMAFGKLAEILPGKPVTFGGQNVMNFLLLGAALAILVTLVISPTLSAAFYGLVGLSLLLGILLVLPIGGADMPVVICLLNSYAGLAASASGFALDNNVLIICGALDGGSGLILAMIMSKAMNRSFANVLFGAFGSDAAAAAAGGGKGGNVREGTVEDAAELLKISQSVIIVPGYGMAVAQAQHATRDLASALAANGTNVKYAIHPWRAACPAT
jgi:NAD(P) transhydrogenase subunit beta